MKGTKTNKKAEQGTLQGHQSSCFSCNPLFWIAKVICSKSAMVHSAAGFCFFFFSLTSPSGASGRVRRRQRAWGDRGDNLVRSGRGSHRLRGSNNTNMFSESSWDQKSKMDQQCCISSKSFRGKFVFLPLLVSSLGISWPLTTSYIFRCLVVFLSASIITLHFSDSHFSASLLLGLLWLNWA